MRRFITDFDSKGKLRLCGVPCNPLIVVEAHRVAWFPTYMGYLLCGRYWRALGWSISELEQSEKVLRVGDVVAPLEAVREAKERGLYLKMARQTEPHELQLRDLVSPPPHDWSPTWIFGNMALRGISVMFVTQFAQIVSEQAFVKKCGVSLICWTGFGRHGQSKGHINRLWQGVVIYVYRLQMFPFIPVLS